MGGFFLFILTLFFVIFLLGGAFLRGIMQFLFKRSTSSFTNFDRRTFKNDNQSRRERQTQSSQHDTFRREHKKVFSKNEGEYVDFEEIK